MSSVNSFALTAKEQKKLDDINRKFKVAPLANTLSPKESVVKPNSGKSDTKKRIFHRDTLDKSPSLKSPYEKQSFDLKASSHSNLRFSINEVTFKKRLVERLYSKPFQYTTVALAFAYTLLALYAFGIDYVPETFPNSIIIGISISNWISILKFILSSFFLIEVLLRVMVAGIFNYWRNLWNIFDFIIVTMCLILELTEIITHSQDIIRYDGYLMVFRFWYAFRTVQLLDDIQQSKEEKLLMDALKRLDQDQTDLTNLRSNVKRMQEDLLEISNLMDRINTSNADSKNANMILHKSAWNRIVAKQTPLTIRTKINKSNHNDDSNADYNDIVYSLNSQAPPPRSKSLLTQPKLIRSLSKENLRRVKNHIKEKTAKFTKPKDQDTSPV